MTNDELKQAIGELDLRHTNKLSELSAEIKRLDVAISGITKLTRENTEWLAICDKAIKDFRIEKAAIPPKAKTFFDWLKNK